MLGKRRPALFAGALAVVLSASCTGTTTITAAEPEPPVVAEVADADSTDASLGGDTGAPAEEAPDAQVTADPEPGTDTDPTAVVAEPTPDDAPPGWASHDVGAFSLAVPNEWVTLTDPFDVEDAIDDAQANGAPFQRSAANEFREMLEGGNALIAIDLQGDNVNAFRQFGPAASLVEHERMVRALEREFDGFASNVAFESEPRLIGDLPGVLVRGRYDIDDETAYMYQFVTHEDAHLYFFTVTFFAGDDPALATELFRSIEIG